MSKYTFLSVVVFDADRVEAEEEPVRVAVERQLSRVQVRRDQMALKINRGCSIPRLTLRFGILDCIFRVEKESEYWHKGWARPVV